MLGLRISIHAPLAGRDAGLFKVKCFNDHFNPRAPCGARRGELQLLLQVVPISIHAPLAGRDGECDGDDRPVDISIHAPLAGRD